MKRRFLFSLLVAIAAVAWSPTWAATKYCDEVITATDGTTQISVSIYAQDDSYVIKFQDADGRFAKVSPISSSVLVSSNDGNKKLSNKVTYNDEGTIICTLADEIPNKIITSIILNMPGSKEFTALTNQEINWDVSCSGGQCQLSDNPEMTSATLYGQPEATKVVLKVKGEDENTDPIKNYIVKSSSFADRMPKAVSEEMAEFLITLDNLTPNTQYEVTVYAQDTCGNVSDEGIAVSFKTAAPTVDTLDYLHFVALNDGDTVRLDKKGDVDAINLQYSKDKQSWTDYTWTDKKGDTIALNQNDTVWFRAGGTGKNTTFSTSTSKLYQFVFGTNDSIAAGGNIMSLYDASCEQKKMTSYGFYDLFKDCKALVTAPELPATQLAQYCYANMFYNCTSLTEAPALPAKTLINSCYMSMFYGCTSLTAAPALNATMLGSSCYSNMFNGCSSLKVDTMGTSCDGVEMSFPTEKANFWNYNMFNGCHGAAASNIQLGKSYCVSKYIPRQVTVSVNDAAMGSVTGAGTYQDGTTVTLTATANEGYQFVQWSNGETANPYSFTVTSDTTLTANFVLLIYSAVVTNEVIEGIQNCTLGSHKTGDKFTYTSRAGLTYRLKYTELYGSDAPETDDGFHAAGIVLLDVDGTTETDEHFLIFRGISSFPEDDADLFKKDSTIKLFATYTQNVLDWYEKYEGEKITFSGTGLGSTLSQYYAGWLVNDEGKDKLTRLVGFSAPSIVKEAEHEDKTYHFITDKTVAESVDYYRQDGDILSSFGKYYQNGTLHLYGGNTKLDQANGVKLHNYILGAHTSGTYLTGVGDTLTYLGDFTSSSLDENADYSDLVVEVDDIPEGLNHTNIKAVTCGDKIYLFNTEYANVVLTVVSSDTLSYDKTLVPFLDEANKFVGRNQWEKCRNSENPADLAWLTTYDKASDIKISTGKGIHFVKKDYVELINTGSSWPGKIFFNFSDKQFEAVGPAGPDTLDYLHFVALNDGDTVRLDKKGNPDDVNLEYSKDKQSWTDYTWTDKKGDTIALNQNDTVWFRAGGTGKNTTFSTSTSKLYQFVFGTNDSIAAGGNIMSLYDATCQQDTMTGYGFRYLFRGCKALVTAPELPATKLATNCYSYMFSSCTSLTVAPTLSAPTLADYCYASMFNGCTSLYVDTLGASCDGVEMSFPETTAQKWSIFMFQDCHGNSQCTAQDGILPGKSYCVSEYKEPVDTLNYLHFVALNDGDTVRLDKKGNSDAINLEYSTDNRQTWTTYNWTEQAGDTIALAKNETVWFRAGGSTGKNAAFSNHAFGYYYFVFGTNDSIAAGGNIMSLYDAALKQDTMTIYGFCNLFKGCKTLVTAPVLPATQLASNCYYGMFQGCTSLTAAPALPAQTLANSCYTSMFKECSSLTAAPALNAMTLTEYCYSSMFSGCTSLTEVPALNAETLAPSCYAGMFSGCTSLYVDTLGASCNGKEMSFPTEGAQNWNLNMFKDCNGDSKYTAQYGIQLGGHYCVSEYKEPGDVATFTVTFTGNCVPTADEKVFIAGNFNDTPNWERVYEMDKTGEATWTYSDLAYPANFKFQFVIQYFDNQGEVSEEIWNPTDTITFDNVTFDYELEAGCPADTLDYLHFVALNDGDTVRLDKMGNQYSQLAAQLQYSTDKQTWTNYTWTDKTGASIAFNQNDTVWFRAGGTGKNATFSVSNTKFYQFVFGTNDSIAAGGNVMSLYDATLEQDTMTGYGFYYLFRQDSALVSAPALPATKLAEKCYYSMFSGCTSLTAAPVLPVTTMAESCYSNMFKGCTSLTTAPTLPAQTLAVECYNQMFQGCTSLIAAPALNVDTLAARCYWYMFYGCTSLTTAPALNATQLADGCYQYMFNGCTSLNVDTMSASCGGKEMSFPATTTASDWNSNMFSGCNGSYTNVQLGGHYCVSEYIEGPDTLNYLHFVGLNGNDTVRWDKSGANRSELTAQLEYSRDNRQTWTPYNWTEQAGYYDYGDTIVLAKNDTVWFRAGGPTHKNATFSLSTQTMIKIYSCSATNNRIALGGNIMSLYDASLKQDTMTKYGFSYLFSGFKALVTAEKLELPATQLADSCYMNMFNLCTSMTTAPALPATQLASGCYYSMFFQASALTAAPKLPATELATKCYQSMFSKCTSLTAAPALPAQTLADNCYNGMFSICTSLTEAPALNAETLAESCYAYMFSGCSSLNVDTMGTSCNGVEMSFPETTTATDWNKDMFKGCQGDTTYTAQYGVQLGGHYCVSEYIEGPDTLDYLHFVALNDGDTVRLDKKGDVDAINLQYSTDNRQTWTTYNWTEQAGDTIALAKNDTVWFRAGGTTGKNATFSEGSSNYYYFVFGTNDSIAAGGNIMSLYDASCRQDTMTGDGFRYLFKDCKALVTAPVLPATQLATYCYAYMFYGCSSLTTAPALPVTTLAEGCYSSMFRNCSSLTAAPVVLPATTMAKSCYQSMFKDCSSLTAAPTLNAETLAVLCYSYMFQNCTSLNVDTMGTSCNGTEMSFPATGAANWNGNMFDGCQGSYTNVQLGGHYCVSKYVPKPAVVPEIVGMYDKWNIVLNVAALEDTLEHYINGVEILPENVKWYVAVGDPDEVNPGTGVVVDDQVAQPATGFYHTEDKAMTGSYYCVVYVPEVKTVLDASYFQSNVLWVNSASAPESTSTRKYIDHQQLIIIREGVKYNAQGQKL